ncbi:MAG: methyltransferase domain-containing protein [Gammaproteobacteria bacterium]|nr:methyltransferase domain-containing protein [Gammaproteobacteria bacterium]
MIMLRFKYQTIEFDKTDIHLRTLRDRQQYLDKEDVAAKLGISSANWSLFGVVWACEEILAHIMFKHDIQEKKILEVGCGIALASLVLKSRHANITATDYHPEAHNFLLENIKLNQCSQIPFVRTNWIEKNQDLDKFDIIIGSDVLYEANNAILLAEFINLHAKPHCKIIIVDPGRKFHSKFSQHMTSLGYSYSKDKYKNIENITQSARGANNFIVLSYHR